jgi:hypothetical protein
METVRTVADMYFDVCSAAGHTYAGVTLSPHEYGHLLAHSHAILARAVSRAEAARVDLESRELTRAISDSARKGTRAMLRAKLDDTREMSVFMSTFRANVARNSPQFAAVIGDLIEAAIARKQLSFASVSVTERA